MALSVAPARARASPSETYASSSGAAVAHAEGQLDPLLVVADTVGIDSHQPIGDLGGGGPVFETLVTHQCQIELLDPAHRGRPGRADIRRGAVQIGVLGIVENPVLELGQI